MIIESADSDVFRQAVITNQINTATNSEGESNTWYYTSIAHAQITQLNALLVQ